MARQNRDKTGLVKCPYCGEMYSTTYKHCPFCNEDGTGSWDEPVKDEDYYEEDTSRGGKRLAGGGRKGGKNISVGTIIYGVISLALIIAAAGIVISIVRPLFGSGKPASTQQPNTTQAVIGTVPGGDGEQGIQGDQTQQPAAPDDGQMATEPTTPAVATTAPQTMNTATPSVDIVDPTSFKLNREDFTLDHAGETFQMKATYTPADAQADISWRSSDPNVASVSWNGVVTAVAPGTVTVTATVTGAGEQSCIVRCNFTGAAVPASETQAPSSGETGSTQTAPTGLKLNRDDFTLSHAGETWRLVLSGSSSTVSWASSDTNVATVGADGTVTAVGPGTCRVTATVDGVTLKCIVRCSF